MLKSSGTCCLLCNSAFASSSADNEVWGHFSLPADRSHLLCILWCELHEAVFHMCQNVSTPVKPVCHGTEQFWGSLFACHSTLTRPKHVMKSERRGLLSTPSLLDPSVSSLSLYPQVLFPAASRIKRGAATVMNPMFHNSFDDVHLLFEVRQIYLWISVFLSVNKPEQHW